MKDKDNGVNRWWTTSNKTIIPIFILFWTQAWDFQIKIILLLSTAITLSVFCTPFSERCNERHLVVHAYTKVIFLCYRKRIWNYDPVVYIKIDRQLYSFPLERKRNLPNEYKSLKEDNNINCYLCFNLNWRISISGRKRKSFPVFIACQFSLLRNESHAEIQGELHSSVLKSLFKM